MTNVFVFVSIFLTESNRNESDVARIDSRYTEKKKDFDLPLSLSLVLSRKEAATKAAEELDRKRLLRPFSAVKSMSAKQVSLVTGSLAIVRQCL